MANTPTSTVTGVLVALTTTPYNFVDKTTGERKSGDTVRCYVASPDGRKIDECKVPAEMRGSLVGIGMGTPVRIECRVDARVTGPNRAVTELTVLAVDVPQPAK